MTYEHTQAAGLEELIDSLPVPPKEHDREVSQMNDVLKAFEPLSALRVKSSRSQLLSLDQCRTVALSLHSALKEHKRFNPDSANLEEAEDMARSVMLDLEKEISDIENYVPHEARCRCDSCIAARSDEYYDRRRDGEMMRRG